MKARFRLSILIVGVLALTLLLAAACVPIPQSAAPAMLPAPAATGNTITGIVWQWTNVTNQTTKETLNVGTPENYTIVFNADGTLTGKADCNTFTGTYSQDNGLVITLGATTMAFCGEASLDQQYLQLLGQIVAGGPDGAGNLALETPGGEQRMLFTNGGAATAPQPPASSSDITGIVWQWTSVTNQTTKETLNVGTPESYTITFNADGTLTGKADCNNFTGTYSQDNGLIITLGATTMAFCGEASLDQQYLQLLGQVVAGGPDGAGNLALETPGGEQRMLFQNGGAAQ